MGAVVRLDGPADLSEKTVNYVLDGKVTVGGPLFYAGDETYLTFFPFVEAVTAGAHQFQINFPGAPASTDFAPVAASESEVLHFNVAQAEPRVQILSSPAEVTAFRGVSVTAQVQSDLSRPAGTVEL